MRTLTSLVASLLLVLGAVGVSLAAETPLPVSPGDASGLALVEDRCPTFNWGAAEGANSYDLVVYLLGAEREEEEPILNQRIAASALGWTPSLERCLERGRRYAWSVRAVGEEGASEWSPPSFFELAAGPSEDEFERAVEIVRQYLAARDSPSDGAAGGAQPAVAADLPLRHSTSVASAVEAGPPASARSALADQASTSSPAWPLTVQAAQAVSYLESTVSPNGSVLELRNTAASPTFLGAINFNNTASTFPGQIGYQADNTMTFRVGNAEQMRITAAGNVISPLDGNGLVKAWAKVSGAGTVECFRCAVATSEKVNTGQYNIDFSPIGINAIGSRVVLCATRDDARKVSWGTLPNYSYVFVQTSDASTGLFTDTDFIILVF